MEMLLYQSTQFRDVKKILDRAHGFAGLLTSGGIEASRLDVKRPAKPCARSKIFFTSRNCVLW